MLKAFPFVLTSRYQLLTVSLIWLILVVLIDPYGEFPYNDDWAYARSVKVLVESGRFFISGWTSVNLLAQMGWGALFCFPFGFSFTALRVSTLVAGLLGLWGTRRLIYNATENDRVAFFGTVLTVANPIYLGLSASFMTDVPFYALTTWSLAYMVIGLKQDSTRPMLLGLGLAVVALLVRQLGIALFAGFSIAYVVNKGLHLKPIIVAGASVAAGLAIQVAYQKWLVFMMPRTISYNVQAMNFFHLSYYRLSLLRGFVNNTFVALMYVGLFMFPYFLTLLTPASSSEFRKHRWLWLVIGVAVISVWQVLFDGVEMPVWFNTLSAFGLGPVLFRDTYYRLHGPPMPAVLGLIMKGVTGMSLVGSAVILYHLIRLVRYLTHWFSPQNQFVIICLLSSVVGIYFLPIGMQVIFDRYLLPMPVLLLILMYLLRSDTAHTHETAEPWPISSYLSTGLIGLYLLFSVCATHDQLAWNRVRWQSLNNLMQRGIKPAEIDGGLEFNGWYLYTTTYKAVPARSWWWVQDDTYLVGTSLLPGYTLFQHYNVDTWFPWGIQEVIIGKKTGRAKSLSAD